MTAALIPHPATSRHAFRAQVCRLVDRLITMLDEIDGDADLEDTGDEEPSLSAAIPSLAWESSQDAWLQGPDTDAEEQCEGEGEACEDEGTDTGDDEPEVGV